MADEYLTWQDLLDEEEAESAQNAKTSAPDSASATTSTIGNGLPLGAQLPAEVQSLLRAREGLEHRMKVLMGQVAPSEEDAHHKAKFPLMVHTKESRMEERRLNLRDEQRRKIVVSLHVLVERV